MGRLILECSRSGERGFLDLEGSLDEEGAAEVKRRAIELITTGCNELLLNLERISSIRPAGLAALARIEAMLPGTKKALTIAAPAPAVRAALDGAGLGELVEDFDAAGPSAELFGIRLISTSA